MDKKLPTVYILSVIFCQLKYLSFVNCAESTALVSTDNIQYTCIYTGQHTIKFTNT